jgi:hypothetical protein
MENYKPINTYIIKGKNLSLKHFPKTPKEKHKMNCISYTSAIGSLISTIMRTQPNICYIVGLISDIN